MMAVVKKGTQQILSLNRRLFLTSREFKSSFCDQLKANTVRSNLNSQDDTVADLWWSNYSPTDLYRMVMTVWNQVKIVQQ